MLWPRSERQVAAVPGSGMSICAQLRKAGSILRRPGSYTVQGVIVIENWAPALGIIRVWKQPLIRFLEGRAGSSVSRVSCFSETAGWEKATAARAGDSAGWKCSGMREGS